MYLSLQGNFGLGKAIEYFTSKSIPVSIPLNDTQKYDLVVDIDNKLYRVSVKTSRNKNEYGTYDVLLKNCGGASGKSISRPFDNQSCDYVFIVAGDDKMYFIPSHIITAKSGISVGLKYKEYEVFSDHFCDFIKKNMVS